MNAEATAARTQLRTPLVRSHPPHNVPTHEDPEGGVQVLVMILYEVLVVLASLPLGLVTEFGATSYGPARDMMDGKYDPRVRFKASSILTLKADSSRRYNLNSWKTLTL